jgi:acetoin:2,6-dichlorophenolindophenol oxidoreductase subunit alpha
MKIQLPRPPAPRPLDGYERPLLEQAYRTMALIRRFEKKVNELFLKGIMPGTIHLSYGQEACEVGACLALAGDDWVNLTHRGHGQALAKGVSARSLMAELFGKATGCCGGKGGSLHVGDAARGALPAIAIVGASSPIMAGMAYAFKRTGTSRVALNFFGDGAVNKGDWHEAMNLASLWALPVVFFCENNLFGVSTHISDAMPNERVIERADAYRMPGETVFGNDVIEVLETTRRAVDRARAGGGPTLIEALTYRQGGHKRDDPATYRDASELAAWLSADPVDGFRGRLAADGRWSPQALAAIEASADQELEEAVAFALASAEPAVERALEDVYAD